MAGRIEAVLKQKSIELPQAATPAANYIPFVLAGKLLFVAGQIPFWNGEIKWIGRVGKDLTVEQGRQAARLCCLNILAQAKAALGGDLDRIARCVKLDGFVQCTEDFTQQPEVVNGASDLLVELFGDAGRHARVAVGSNALPRGVAVEVAAIFELA
jgi:enamine deaminase RidA (YjgF/YER057c/UK114 family)